MSELKWQIQSSSPGLIMVTLGVVLMLTTIMMQHQFSVTDKPVFLVAGRSAELSLDPVDDALPLPLPAPEEEE